MRYRLCALEDIPEGGSKGFPNPEPSTDAHDSRGVFAVRSREQVYVYRNRCPHQGLELNWVPDRFLDRNKALILCSAHGALFEIAGGRCVSGPCLGQQLEQLPSTVESNGVYVELTP